MKTGILERKNNLILDYTFSDEKKIKILDWQKIELDKTYKRIKEEFKRNGFIKTTSIEESYNKTTNFINNLYKI